MSIKTTDDAFRALTKMTEASIVIVPTDFISCNDSINILAIIERIGHNIGKQLEKETADG